MCDELGSESCLVEGQDSGEDDNEAKPEPVPSFTEVLYAFETMRAFVYGHDVTEKDQANIVNIENPDKNESSCVRDLLWRREVPLKRKEILYMAYFVPIVTYAAETRTMSVRETRKVEEHELAGQTNQERGGEEEDQLAHNVGNTQRLSVQDVHTDNKFNMLLTVKLKHT
ncbi:unnamed protein product [Timema podura]|uniref:Uncharacterized protein n=1 Tax=Timema podura TaxID=61482 RepID=A0ABN7NZ10_TIMPD|nr:unnamed protein product [Timema podura]